MSRTYRRKNVAYYYTEDEALTYSYTYSYYHEPRRLCESKEEYKEEVRKFHSELRWGYYGHGIPGWFINLYCNRPRRRKNKAFCRKVLELTDYENVSEPVKYVKDAAWLWW